MNLLRMIVALLALAIAVPALAADVTFTGAVTYRERLVLPPDATLTVTLVRLPDQQRITGATASLGDKAGSPIQFTLNVRSTALASGGDYGLLAEISSSGLTIFRSVQPVAANPLAPAGNLIRLLFTPPLPHDPPEQILPPVTAPPPLLEVLWTVTSIGGDPVLPRTVLTFSIALDNRAGGTGGCNNYFTEADLENTPLSFGPIAGTRMACDPAVMAQEARFFTALAATAGYDVAGNTLKLVDAAGVPLIGLVRRP